MSKVIGFKEQRRRSGSTPPVPLYNSSDKIKNIGKTLWRSALFENLKEDRLTQAFYYSAANALLLIVIVSGIALWFVFQEFIEPLFWAVLCGALLHPIKTKWVKGTDNWLNKISTRKIPFLFGLTVLILSIPGMIFRLLTRNTSRTITLGIVLFFQIIIELLGWVTILEYFVIGTKLVFANTRLIIETLIFSGVVVREITTHITPIILITTIILYIGFLYLELNDYVNKTFSLVTKWIMWIFLAINAYPFIVYNWITVLSCTAFILCALLGLYHRMNKQRNNIRVSSSTNIKEGGGSLATELNTILIIFCVMYLTNVVQLIAFLLAISVFYWFALGVRYIAIKIFSYKKLSQHIAPKPIQFLWDCFEDGDQILVIWIRNQLHTLFSIFIIGLLITGVIAIVIFFSVQLYHENTELAENIWESRKAFVPEFEFVKNLVNQTGEFDELYNTTRTLVMTHGKDWIQDRVTDITGNEVNIDDLQQKIGDIWESTNVFEHLEWNVPTSIVADLVRSGDAASFWKAYGSNVSMVIQTIWSQLVLNIRLVWWIVMKGWGIFNFLFSLLLFITALFYLIATSTDDTYKPMSWILFFFPEESFRDQAADLINESVSQVFKIAFKLALFHALWCWITYSIFGCHVVYMPTVLAAITALIPLLPTYFGCIPGVLELWLVWERPFSAISFFILHLAASWWVDPLVYSEIESSHHYITGLSVVGGLYFFGVQGVLIGPMLVCALLIMRKLTIHMGNHHLNKNNE